MTNLLEIKNLSIAFDDNQVVNDISFNVKQGEILGIVGESGSGKSSIALSILQLLPYPKASHPSGSIKLEQKEIIGLSEDKLCKIRGVKASMIFQEPLSSLNPLHTIGKQIGEVLKIHTDLDKEQIRTKVIELLDLVQIPNGLEKYHAYPHELSGGQRQRVIIAIALANNPKLLIADEPTTALDVTVQKEILDLLKNLQQRLNMTIIFISHDLSVIKYLTDKTIVMKDGIIVEQGNTTKIFKNPEHKYTQNLIASQSKKTENKISNNSILKVKNLTVKYPIKKSIFGKVNSYFTAVNNVSFSVKKGEILGIVGESGSGKTTIGNAITRLLSYDGEVIFDDVNITKLPSKNLRKYRKDIQIIFQDPYNSLNPRFTVKDIIGEGLDIHYPHFSKQEKTNLIIKTMKETGLNIDFLNRYPNEFSGGQRQRIAIARAIILKPRLIILDEPTSALDITIQSQIIELLQSLQKKHNLSYIFISHDIKLIKEISNSLLVLKQGKIIEFGQSDKIFNSPEKNYTNTLVKSSFLT